MTSPLVARSRALVTGRFRGPSFPILAAAALVMALLARPGVGQVDNLAAVLDARPMIGTKTLGAYGYDPAGDRMFLIAYGGDPSAPGNPGVVRVSDVSSSPTAETLLSQTQLQLYYTDGNPNLASPPTPGGLLLNPKPIGTTPAYGMAIITDGEVTRLSSGSAVPSLSRRVYAYDLQSPPPGGDGRAVFTTRVTLADMQAAAGATSSSSFVQRQFAWSGDGQSIYFVDSSGGYGGLWKAGALAGAAQRIVNADLDVAEPAVRSAGGIDSIFVGGGGANAGGVDVVTHDGTTTSPRQVAVPTAKLLDFFEVSTLMPLQRIQSLTTVGDDLYFIFYTNASGTNPLSRYPGLYRSDAGGRISKVVNRTQRSAALGSVNLVLDHLQSRTIAATGGSGTFAATQLLYREGGLSTVAGATAFKPVDFNRDNQITAADLALFTPQVTVRGQVKATTTSGTIADLKFDMNGNDTVDWKDVQIVEGFLDYVPDPALAGRLVPALPIQADADLNGVVDFNDFLTMQAAYGTTSQPFTQGDYNGDNEVSFPDLQPWINSYGFRSAVVGGGVPMAAFDQTVWNQFLAGLTPPAVTLDVATGQQTQFQAGYRTIVIAASVTKTGSGTLVYDAANTYTCTTNVAAGTLRLADPAAVASSTVVPQAGGRLTVAAGLQATVGGLQPLAGGLVDVGSGMVTVAARLSATDLVMALLAGKNGPDGGWDGGSGITSSVAATTPARTVGWLDNGGGSVTFAFAAAGDTNLDWQVDILDSANFLSSGKLDTGLPASWIEGDFTYDGVVDVLDAAAFLSTGLLDAGPYNPPATQAAGVSVGAGGVAAVPEPHGVALAGIATGLAALARRRSAVRAR
ncbi:MAG: autotransporter-associated beta strand repeat-containing protein [Planctomycetaceae bacterium]